MAAPAAAAGAGAAPGGAGGGSLGLPKGLDLPRPQRPRPSGWLKRLAQALLGLLGFLLTLLLLVLIPVVAVVALPELFLDGSYTRAPGIPAQYWPIYKDAGEEYDVSPYLLASIHKIETDFGNYRGAGVRSGANSCGAAGPMQFGVVGVPPYNASGSGGCSAGPTWRSYWTAAKPIESKRPEAYELRRSELSACDDVPKNVGCVYDSFDAIASAAKKLRADGADDNLESSDTYNAVLAYNHSDEYVNDVLQQARRWEADSQPTSIDLEEAVQTTRARSLARLKAVANAIDELTESGELPYCWGGGHDSRPGPSEGSYCWQGDEQISDSSLLGLDCSGAVRLLLTESGFDDPGPIGSGSYGGFLNKGGAGEHTTIYYNAEHTYAVIDGRVWQTSTSNRNHGPGWTASRSSAGYESGHLDGM